MSGYEPELGDVVDVSCQPYCGAQLSLHAISPLLRGKRGVIESVEAGMSKITSTPFDSMGRNTQSKNNIQVKGFGCTSSVRSSKRWAKGWTKTLSNNSATFPGGASPSIGSMAKSGQVGGHHEGEKAQTRLRNGVATLDV